MCWTLLTQIPLRVARHYYLLFASSVSKEEQTNIVLFHRWEPLDNFSMQQPLPVNIMEDIEASGMVCESREIRELQKYNHAPTGGLRFDLDGRLHYSARHSDDQHVHKRFKRARHAGTDVSSRQ